MSDQSNKPYDIIQAAKKIVYSNRKRGEINDLPLLEALGRLSAIVDRADLTKEEKNEACGLAAVICCYLNVPAAASKFYCLTREREHGLVDRNLYCMIAASYVNLEEYLFSLKIPQEPVTSGIKRVKHEIAQLLVKSTNTVATAFKEKCDKTETPSAFDMLFDAHLVFDLAQKLQSSGVLVERSFYKSLLFIPWQKTGALSVYELPDNDGQTFQKFDYQVYGFISLLPEDPFALCE